MSGVSWRQVHGAFACATALLLAASAAPSCASTASHASAPLVPGDGLDPVTEERDRILSLLAYSVVFQDWQESGDGARGYNIGAVLVSPAGEPVAWSLNCNNLLQDGTQHAETRLIQHWLRDARSYNLEGFEIFTTLEPCAQCSGMMAMQKIRRAVYGQTDDRYGKAIERLALDSRAVGGFEPYPRFPTSERARLELTERIDASASRSGQSITDWLYSASARELFEAADRELETFDPVHAENRLLLERALELRTAVPASAALPMS